MPALGAIVLVRPLSETPLFWKNPSARTSSRATASFAVPATPRDDHSAGLDASVAHAIVRGVMDGTYAPPVSNASGQVPYQA